MQLRQFSWENNGKRNLGARGHARENSNGALLKREGPANLTANIWLEFKRNMRKAIWFVTKAL